MKIKIKHFLFLLLIILFSCSKQDLKWNLIKSPEIGYLYLKSNEITGFDLESECFSTGFDKECEMGFCWSKLPDPTLNDSVIKVNNKKEGKFNTSIEWTSVSTYYIRSFVKNKVSTNYSQSIIVNWPGNISLPSIQTTSLSGVSFYSMTVNCEIISTYGQPILSEGVYLSTSPNPTSSNSLQIFSSPNNLGSFSHEFAGLNDGLTYYVRGFINTIAGEGLGNILSVTLPKKYAIGDIGPAGGIIFHENSNLTDTWHYLEACQSDFGVSLNWSPTIGQSNILSMDLGQGIENTNEIVGIYGNSPNYAALAAYLWSWGGTSDWALPSFEELKLMKENIFDNNEGNFSIGSTYWSSSEDENYYQNAWTVKMINSGLNLYTTHSKTMGLKIRCIRRF
jgi:hypothetical protein